MGGSRCSYRNCSVRSGTNKVHMFHFPVYDKNRCHQWLANAQKFEFLNLKLSQLRNRIVCQYHFNDDCFMNYKKDKLTHNAIPTEDGPYCETSKLKAKQEPVYDVTPIILNEEGDDKYYKKHKSSIIYADFLTNGDYWEKQSLNETIWNNKVDTNKTAEISDNTSKHIDIPVKNDNDENSLITLTWPEGMSAKVIEIENPMETGINHDISDQRVKSNSTIHNTRKVLRYKSSKYEQNNLLVSQGKPLDSTANQMPSNNPVSVSQEMQNLLFTDSNNEAMANLNQSNNIVIEQYANPKWHTNPDDLLIPINYNQDSVQQYAKISAQIQENNNVIEAVQGVSLPYQPPSNCELNQDFQTHCNQSQENQNQKMNEDESTKPKIQILLEEKITEPIKITHNLEPISPSAVINISSIKKRTRGGKRIRDDQRIHHSTSNVVRNTGKTIKSNQQTVKSCKNNEKPNEIVPKSPAVKHKISPERIAAIEKKRSFNKKLRDIIETCLEKLDEQDRTSSNMPEASSPKVMKNNQVKNYKQHVSSYLSKEPKLPDVHEYTMKFIEARMQKMENVLLSKIDENSQKIVELRKCIDTKPQAHKAKATQTSTNEEAHKKQLYQELSKFLSPSAKSLVYEELFINKSVKKISNQPSPKRRKRR